MTITSPTARVSSAFAPEFIADVLTGGLTLVCVCHDDGEYGASSSERILTLDILDELVADCDRLGYDIPVNMTGDKAKAFVCECLESDDSYSCILSREQLASGKAKKFDSYISSLNLPGTPGDVEWFDALERMYDREAGENSGERKAERYAEMRFGAQSEEGFYSDCDTASVNASKLNEVQQWARKHLPASYALWLESRK